jgi:ceramide glucosyltransferase
MRTALILTFVVLTGTCGEISLTHAMKRVGEVRDFSPGAIGRVLLRSFREVWLWIAVALMAASFYGFLTMLSWYPVSFVVPATSLAYVAGALGAKFLLRERLSATRWAGVGFISLGVALAWTDLPTLQHLKNLYVVLRDLTFAAALVPLAFYLFSGWAAWRFFKNSRSHIANNAADFTPPLSILKPLRGLDRGAYENFASFCRQDYAQYEILFAASDETDPAVPVVRSLIRDFPDIPIRLLIDPEAKGTNDKVGKLCLMAQEARYPLLVIADSDVRVAADYLRKVAAIFRDPQVGAVTALYRALEAPSFGAVMDTMGSLSFSGSALVARALEGIKFTMGSTIALTRERLAEIGGFAPLLDMHSDDYELGRRIAQKGYRVELAPDPVDMQFPSESFGDYLRHELRWLVGLRHIRPGGHFGLLMTQGIAWAAAAAILAPSWKAGLAWLFAYLIIRLVSGYVIGAWGLRDPVVRPKIWLLPLHDLFWFFLWLASFALNRIEWRGLVFTLEKGRMIPVTARREGTLVERTLPGRG